MAVLTQSSELITHQVAATPLPNSSAFVTVRDEDGLPLVFSIGNNGILYALKENETGARVLINLNVAFGIPDLEVTSFDVTQDWDNNLFMAIAHSVVEGSEKSPMIITIPFSPKELDVTAEEELELSHLKMPEGGGTATSIEKIYMVSTKHVISLVHFVLLRLIYFSGTQKQAAALSRNIYWVHPSKRCAQVR